MHPSAGWYGDHTVDATSDGVTVRKGLDLDTLALPALKFEIRSDRDDPVGVRVVDRLPATVSADRVGVHADFAADQWTAFEDGRVTFTTRLDPDRPVVTLYGIWLDDPERVTELLGRPTVLVASDPDAPSLEPVGDAVTLPTVDDSLRSVGPDALAELRTDVEEALTGPRAEPDETATALPAPDAGGGDPAEPAGTMGDHAWTYPVERMGTGRVAAPTHADLDELVEEAVGEDHVYLRAALTETHHGGGGALLLQELANAFEVVARRVTGDAERATVDAVVKTPLDADAVLSALVDREQVTDAMVSPLVGDRDDATGIDATPEEDTPTDERADTEEVSIEPDADDVEVVLNADGERFSELKAEFERETDTEALEDELADLDLPGVDTGGEPTIDELVDGDDTAFAPGDDGGFVPASVDGDDEDFEFDFGSDADAAESSTKGETDAEAEATADADATDADATDAEAEATADADAIDDAAFDFGSVPAFDPSEAGGFVAADDADGTEADAADDAVGDASHAGAGSDDDAVETVEVPVEDLAALRAEVRELRDRVATLESELEAVRDADDGSDDAMEWDVDASETDAFEHLDPVEGAEDMD